MNPKPENDVLKYLSADLAWQYRAIPYEINGNILTLLISDEAYHETLTGELELITGYGIRIIRESAGTIDKHLSQLYRKNGVAAGKPAVEGLDTFEKDFLLKIIFEARALSSSDVHIEPSAEQCRIRFRIDGRLVERYQIPKEEFAAFVNKIKIKAKLDIAEKRLPQDGRILLVRDNQKMDIRVSILPALHGEKIVLRLLNNDASHIQIENLGLSGKQQDDFYKVLKKPHGIILISGPTGSGKTTTLYATLKILNKESNNILTIEDPIEYTLDGINQVQVRENIGLTFSQALRTFLRQDPDIIMLGEIRDAETAQMAIRAALTGHLVLSTIHTNSAWGTVSRLIDMGIPTFLLANTLNMTIAQRLVRKLCTACKRTIPFDTSEFPDIAQFAKISAHAVSDGCASCFYTGYMGRIAIYEVIPVQSELSVLIKENALGIDPYLEKMNIPTLKHRALELIMEGTTSIEEIYPIFLNQ
jgi:type IV pilus assembly protein PilB